MSNRIRILPALLSALLVAVAVPAPAGAAPGAATLHVQAQQSRLGGGFRGARRPSFGTRYRSRPSRRTYRRPSLVGGILRALGVAYLLHMLFGIGAGGGSPFGLLLLVAFVAWLVTRGRRRRVAY
jgi:uncharacterized membrane protein